MPQYLSSTSPLWLSISYFSVSTVSHFSFYPIGLTYISQSDSFFQSTNWVMMFLPLHKTLQLFLNVLRLKSWLKVCPICQLPTSPWMLLHFLLCLWSPGAETLELCTGSLLLPDACLLLTSTELVPPSIWSLPSLRNLKFHPCTLIYITLWIFFTAWMLHGFVLGLY